MERSEGRRRHGAGRVRGGRRCLSLYGVWPLPTRTEGWNGERRHARQALPRTAARRGDPKPDRVRDGAVKPRPPRLTDGQVGGVGWDIPGWVGEFLARDIASISPWASRRSSFVNRADTRCLMK